MSNYMNFARDLTEGNMIEAALSCAMPMFHNGKAICLSDIKQQKEYGDISCYNGVLIDVKCKNQKTPNMFTANPGVELFDGDRLGWFLNPNKKTTHYIFVNYWADKPLSQIDSVDQFKKLNCMLFSRKEFMKCLEDNRITRQTLIDDRNQLDEHNYKKQYRKNGKWVATMTYSHWLDEGPTNLTLDMNLIMNLPTTKFFWIEEKKVKKCEKSDVFQLLKK